MLTTSSSSKSRLEFTAFFTGPVIDFARLKYLNDSSDFVWRIIRLGNIIHLLSPIFISSLHSFAHSSILTEALG